MTGFQKYRRGMGGLLGRSQTYHFKFDNKSLTGYEGDTLASALLANGIKLVARSFKYHRPRGILTAGSEEPNALVTLRRGGRAEPNTRATTIQLFDGLEATSQNRWPSLTFDVMSVSQLAAPFLIAGFYYKTFMWPAVFWEKLYEPLIRRAAGLGKLSGKPDPDMYDRQHAFCDVLVIGSGPAGLGAALTAGRAGARVILVEDDWLLGGRLLAERREIDGRSGTAWVEDTAQELDSLSNVKILRRTTIFGIYDDEYAGLERITDHLSRPDTNQPRQRFWKIVAKRAVLATGAIERPLVFGGNDRPGIMMASAVSAYLNRYAVIPGQKVVVFTTSDSGWDTVLDLVSANISITAVVEARANAPAGALAQAQSVGVRVFLGAVVTQALGSPLRSIQVRTSHGDLIGISADLLAVAGGWNPNFGLGCNLGHRPEWSEDIGSFVLRRPPRGTTIVGAANGSFSLGAALREGFTAGAEIARDLGFNSAHPMVPACSADEVSVTPLWHVAETRGTAFVDFQNDVTDKDVALGAREGFVSVEHLKRYTTLGMATDQGKAGQVIGHALLAMHTGKTIAEAGTIRSRPPFVPVAIGACAGHARDERFRPTRLTASHDWAVEQGATFVDAAAWKRAQWYRGTPGEDWLSIVSREVLSTRRSVGICDVSTLGKIEVHGTDAAVFLDRLYTNVISSLPVGKVRYGVMLREDGIVMDDGTVACFAPDRYFITTTTANAVKVAQHIDFCRQVLWPHLDVQAVSVTEQWAQFAIAGPKSRPLLQKLLPNCDLTNEAFPYMAVAELSWSGLPVRLYRVSFSGELAYEIGIPAAYGDALIRALMSAGAEFGVVPYGTEALSVMRIEKGHIAGNELNGQTTAGDLGLGRMMSAKKDYIGATLARRPGLTDPCRPTLVGIRPVVRTQRFEGGAHLLPIGAPSIAANDQGFVTSVAFSPNLGHWIGLALLRRGSEKMGQRLRAYDPLRGRDTEIEICSPVFVDPEGARVRV